MKWASLALVLTVVLTGCSGSSDKTPTDGTSASASASPTRDTELRLGEATTQATARWQALEYRTNALPGDEPPSGRWDAVRWRNCNISEKRKGLQQEAFLTSNFILRDADGGEYKPVLYSGGKQPIYPDERRLQVGECVTGWIMYDVPTSLKAVDVSLISGGDRLFTWSLR